jgi:uncharacterized membrane protein YoaT (DUF817 family)
MHRVWITLGLVLVILFVWFAARTIYRFISYCLADLARQSAVALLPRETWRLLIIVCIPIGGMLYLRFGRTRTPL